MIGLTVIAVACLALKVFDAVDGEVAHAAFEVGIKP